MRAAFVLPNKKNLKTFAINKRIIQIIQINKLENSP